MTRLHWPAIGAATAVYFLLGVPWFSPATLGPAWERALGFQRPPGWEPGVFLYLGPLASCFASTVVTAWLIRATSAATLAAGARLGAVVALGFSTAVAFVDAISPSHHDPLTLFLITGSYHLVGLTAAGAILGRWQKG